MKKAFSIFFVFLTLLCGIRYTYATHYCGGKVVASKISLSGELASCGMEGSENSCPESVNHLTSHCCDNKVSVFSVDNTYTSSISAIKNITQNIFQIFYIPASSSFYSSAFSDSLLSFIKPPGNKFTSEVKLSGICILRI